MIWAVVKLLILASALIGAQGGNAPVVWTGGHSQVTKADISLVKNEAEWIRVWMRHIGQTAKLAELEKYAKENKWELRYDYYNEANVPFVNFDEYAVVSIFGGKTHQNAGYDVISTNMNGNVLILRYASRPYSVIHDPQDPERFANTPFAFIMLPRKFSALRIEEGIHEAKGVPIKKFVLRKEISLLP